MLYDFYEWGKTIGRPMTFQAKTFSDIYLRPESYLSFFPGSKAIGSFWEVFYRLGRDYEKPQWNIHQISINGQSCPVVTQTVLETPFCNLVRFKRFADNIQGVRNLKDDPTVLVVAPLSGHHATLLRDTVETLLQDHKVYVTDWKDARFVPQKDGDFRLEDYVKLVETFLKQLLKKTPNVHVFAVCQPVVPVIAAVSRMNERGEVVPKSMILMGGPIDARESPTTPNNLATKNSYQWFEDNLIYQVPVSYEGRGRRVYPGFLQHFGFVAMNPERHAMAHVDFYEHLLRGDQEDAAAHRSFYNEYNAVLDMPAEYYLDTIKIVFQDFLLPKHKWFIDGKLVDLSHINKTSLLTIEGERDDISGQGQTKAAHKLCTGLAPEKKEHLLAKKVGHYGLFSGRRWREEVYPVFRDFVSNHNQDK